MVALDAVMLQPTTLDWLAGGKMVRYRLVTHHDTIVYWDPQTKEIRHALFGSALLNIALQRLGDQAVLLISVSQGTSNHGMAGFAKDLMVDAGGQPVIGGIVVESLTEDVVGLRIGTHYLSADTDGLIRNDRPHCREWERYRLVREDTLDGIAIASRFSWVSHSDRRLLTLPVEAGTRLSSMQELQFGGARVPIQCSSQSIFFEHSGGNLQPLPAVMHVIGAQGQLQSFSRYMPLVYFFVYGHESFYQCLQLTLSSLERYGRYDGTIAIACDLDADRVLKYVPKSFRDRCMVTEASKERGYFNRYFLDEELYARYQPIVCSDVDVVFDCEVTDLLIDVLRQDKVCLATEDIPELAERSPRLWPEYTGNFFGRYLYAAEREFPLQGIPLGNAGFIGFPNLYRVRHLYDLLKSVASRQTPQQIKDYTDQAILNYVLNKTASGDYSVMNRYGRISRNLTDVPVSERTGFVHFHLDSGVADAASKLSTMKSYLNRLSMPAHETGNAREVHHNTEISGQLSNREIKRLAQLAKCVPPNGCIVEIGSLFGLSSWILAKNAHPSVTVYCIDPWIREPWMAQIESEAGQYLSLDTFRQNVRDCPNIIPLPGYSPVDFVGWQRRIDLLFEDSVHSNPILHGTLSHWAPLVHENGVICGHDYCDQFPDVKAEVDRLAVARNSQLELVDTLWSLTSRAECWGQDRNRTATKSGFPERESTPDGTVVRNIIDGQSISFLVINPHDEIMKYHHAGAFYEAEELELIKRHCTGEGVFVDIGANVGNHSVYASRFLRCSRIVPFEPNQAAIAIMRENLQLNRCSNVDTRFLGIALAGKKGRLRQATPDANNLGHTLYLEDGTGDIQAIDGDALIGDEPIEFIKIDVEGMELEILSGLERTIKRWQPAIFVEVWDDRLASFVDWCERASYQLVERFRRYEVIENYLIKPISRATMEA